MAEKSFIITSSINAGQQNTTEHPQAIPNGKKWIIDNFGCADINLGDNISSVYILRFGTEVIRIVSLTGDTKDFNLGIEIVGDGVKKLNVIRQNRSSHDKELPCWIMAHEVN